jgi:hypothetical protein
MSKPLVVGAALAAALALIAGSGCGNPGGDLIAIEEHGAGRVERLVVTDDGRGSCNGGELKYLVGDRLLEAREAERDLQDLPGTKVDFGRLPGRTVYTARMRESEVSWSEGARQPPVLPRATLLALKLRRELCPASAGP